MTDSYVNFRSDKFCRIYIGDSNIGFTDYQFPRLSGNAITDLAMEFDIDISDYCNDSRSYMMKKLLEFATIDGKLDDVLTRLFNSINFELTTSNYDNPKTQIIRVKQEIINCMNMSLVSNNCILLLDGNRVIARLTKEHHLVDSKFELLKSYEINDHLIKCKEDMANNDVSGAILHATDILESVFLTLLESNQVDVEHNGNLLQYWNKIKELYMFDKNNVPTCISEIITSFNTIIQKIGGSLEV